MRRSINNIIAAVFLFLLQNSIFPLLSSLHFSPNLLLIFTLTIAFVNGEMEGMLYGLLCGTMVDLFYDGPFGFFLLAYLSLGFANGFFSRYYTEENIVLPLILCVIFDFLFNVYVYFFAFYTSGNSSFGYYMKSIIIPELIFTLLFFFILYKPVLQVNKKLRIEDDKRGSRVVR